MLYLAFPTENSVNFPSRDGTLNFYDDETHIFLPKYNDILTKLEENGVVVSYSCKEYHPFVLKLWGAIIEPLSKKKKKVYPGTWAFWGFETKIWGNKE